MVLGERALAIRRATLGDGHPLVAATLNDLGLAHLTAGDTAAARAAFEQSAAAWEHGLQPADPDRSNPLFNLAGMLREGGERRAAAALYRQVLEIRQRAYGPRHNSLMMPCYYLGILEREIRRVKQGRYVLIPISDETRGHGTHSRPAVWKQHLEELLARSQPSDP